MAASSLQWLRIVGVALLIEVVLIILAIPFNLTLNVNGFVASVLVLIVVVPFFITRWAARKIRSRVVLHGFLVGVVASLIYLALVFVSPGGIQLALEIYGPFIFVLANGLRIAATVLGAAAENRKRASAKAAIA